MRILESGEDYLERILMLKKEKGMVRAIDIANDMSYSKPSVSVAMKNLRENGYIIVNHSTGAISLTEAGEQIATKMYERHCTISEFLISLGVPKSIALEDACKIEHDLSDESFNAIKNAYKGK